MRTESKGDLCPVCSVVLDEGYFSPQQNPWLEKEICEFCNYNISLMFTNFELSPGLEDDGYIVPDWSDRLSELTGRSYLENRLLYYQDFFKSSLANKRDSTEIESISEEVAKIKLLIQASQEKGLR